MDAEGLRQLGEDLATHLDEGKVSGWRSGRVWRGGGLTVTGTHAGRTVWMTLHAWKELKTAVCHRASCRWLVVRNTPTTRLGFLRGARVATGNQEFDRRYLVRSQGGLDLRLLLERSDIMALLPRLEPFFEVRAEPGLLLHYRNVRQWEQLGAGDILTPLEVLAGLADILEEAAADRSNAAGKEPPAGMEES